MASEDAPEVGICAFCFNTWRRVRILGWMDFEAKHRVAWGTRSVQIEKSKEDADIGSYREERSLKVKGVWVLEKGLLMGKAFFWVAAWDRSALTILVVGSLRWPGIQQRAQVSEAEKRNFSLIPLFLPDSYSSSNSAHLSSPL